MTLSKEIEEFRSKFSTMVSVEKVAAIERGIRAQKLEGRLLGPVGVGDVAPDFSAIDIESRSVTLSSALARGPVVITFYRGGWCPYCNLELRAYQKHYAEFAKAGAQILAMSPEAPEYGRETSDKNRLSFSVITDAGSKIAESFGLVFELSEELAKLYTEFGHPLSQRNAHGDWRLPVPATYVVDRERRIRFAYVNFDYRERCEPEVVLAAVRKITGGQS